MSQLSTCGIKSCMAAGNICAATDGHTSCLYPAMTHRCEQACQEQQRQQPKQRQASTSAKRDPLQHMHFNSLFNGIGIQDEDVYDYSGKHCTSAQKLQRMPASGLTLQEQTQ